MARKAKGGKTAAAKPAKGRKASAKPPEETEVVESTLLLPDPSVVQKLAKAKLKLQKANSSASGEFGQQVGEAVESKHLDRKAFGIACQFNKMFDNDPEKMAITYFHLLRYLDDLDIPNKAKANEGMFTAAETGPGLKDGDTEESEAGEGEGGDNVTPIGSAARRVAESAGGKLN